VVESFMDELATAAKQDPVAYRLALQDKTPRAKAVLALAAEKAGWGQPLPERDDRGVSLQFVFATFMAQLAEVEVSEDERFASGAWCARSIAAPWSIPTRSGRRSRAGSSSASRRRCMARLDGRVEQTNFDTYQMLRMNEAPAIEVHIVASSEPPGGMGEAGTSAIVPAVANAIFAATGKRLRKMPVDTAALKQPT
jgi:isoquinoline 1-oxidoreductase subunit beta